MKPVASSPTAMASSGLSGPTPIKAGLLTSPSLEETSSRSSAATSAMFVRSGHYRNSFFVTSTISKTSVLREKYAS